MSLLQGAYKDLALGRQAEARYGFERAVKLIGMLAPDGGCQNGYTLAPARGKIAAVEGCGVLFFDDESGVPLGYEPHARLDERRWIALPDAPLFELWHFDDQHEHALYDAKLGAPVVHGASFLAAPDGKTIYVFKTSDCRWHEWNVTAGRETGVLEASGEHPPDRADFMGATCDRTSDVDYSFIGPDGRWLFGVGGRWDLRTRRLRRYPGGGLQSPTMARADSPDGRYIVYYREDLVGTKGYQRLVVFDQRTGNETMITGPRLTGYVQFMDYLEAPPLRLRIQEYPALLVVTIPSLTLVAHDDLITGRPVVGRKMLEEPALPRPEPTEATYIDLSGTCGSAAGRAAGGACSLKGYPLPCGYCVNVASP